MKLILENWRKFLKEYREIDIEREEGLAWGVVHSEPQSIVRWADKEGISVELIAQLELPIAILKNINVNEDYRDQGHGTEMLQEFIYEVENAGAKNIILIADMGESQQAGFDLEQWYKNNGFETIDYDSGDNPVMLKSMVLEELFALPGKTSKKLKKEGFPHAGQVGGYKRKHAGEKEHAGHVERSRHQGLKNVMQEVDQARGTHLEAMKKVGIMDPEFISSGMHGSVYKGIWEKGNYEPVAIKALNDGPNGHHEAKVYKTVSEAREKNPLIAKHFPKVYHTFHDKVMSTILIVMELLEHNPAAEEDLKNIFGYTEVDQWRPDLALADLDIYKDLSKRAEAAVIDEKTRAEMLKFIKPSALIPKWDEIVDKIMMIPFGSWRKENYRNYKTLTMKMVSDPRNPKSSELTDYLNVMQEDAGHAVRFHNFIYFLSVLLARHYHKHIMPMAIKAGDKKIAGMEFIKSLEEIYRNVIDWYRWASPVAISPYATSGGFTGAPKKTKGAGYWGASSVIDAIHKLREVTGLEAGDLHHKNVLTREGTGEIVIVDLGWFKFRGNVPYTSPSQQITDLGETIKRMIAEELQKFT